jgi:trehalose 6-phosphate synthase
MQNHDGQSAPAIADAAELVVVANRLPVRVREQRGVRRWETSPGGLVSALAPVLRERGGLWVGSAETARGLKVPESHDGIALKAVSIERSEYDDFYVGFANGTLWPLYHDAIRAPTFERRWWHAYVTVNRRYAEAVAEVAAEGSTVWVHDYHLQLVPRMLRQLRPDVKIGFFLHIPFPPQELFVQLPWRREIVDGLLGSDLVGFQVPGAATNFARLARRLTGATGSDALLTHGGRSVRVGAFPISIDAADITRRACDPAVRDRAREIRHDLGDPEIVMLGVDRLDYTKGIDHRFKAVAELFEEGTLHAPRHVLVQIAVPSREEDAHYQHEREHLEQLVGEVNGQYARVGHPAIHYLYQSFDNDELVALYLAADIMLVTPLRDGMNLVAKEYVAARVDNTGSLVLSEFAGAARELRSAILVNPHDVDGVKAAIRHALAGAPSEAAARMRRLRRVVRRRDVHAWARSFLATLQSGEELVGSTRARMG